MSERKIFRDLTEHTEAWRIFTAAASALQEKTETIALLDGLGRVLAEDVYSPMDVPPFDRASMDGFAVQALDTVGAVENNRRRLQVIGEIKAGYVFAGIVGQGQGVEISTGAPLPVGADAVVMVEYADRTDNVVDIFRSVSPGENVMMAGGDIQKGERVMAKSTLMTSRELAVLSAMGITSLIVYKKPSVAIYSSGDELLPLGAPYQPGKLYDINSTAIITTLLENHCDPHFLGIILDQEEDLKDKLAATIGKYDLVLLSGGTSAGLGDLLYRVVDELGEPGLLVHGVKVKPGKPTILAVCDGTPIIGLPGYPASAMSIFNLFAVPYIRQFGHLPALDEAIGIKAVVQQKLRSVMGRHEFKPMNLVQMEDVWHAYPVPGGSGAITSIAMADGFVEIPSDQEYINAGSEILVRLFSKSIQPVDLQIIGSHCIALARLLGLMQERYPAIRTRVINVGSSGGLAAVRRGEAHLAGVHLFDQEKGYNTWLERQYNVRVIPGYYRMQGIIIKKGNPKHIKTIKDLTQEGVRFINRNPGSGTRLLFDGLLADQGIDSQMISGYDQFVKSHTGIADAIRLGKADVGIAIQQVVDEQLEFIPIKEEEYDFIVATANAELPVIKQFIHVLRSKEFQAVLSQLEGYRVKDST